MALMVSPSIRRSATVSVPDEIIRPPLIKMDINGCLVGMFSCKIRRSGTLRILSRADFGAG
jgi:hypothetical protein